MHIEHATLERAMGRLASPNLARLGLSAALGEIVAALPALFDVDGAGVLLLDEEQVLRYAASTDAGARLLEAVQESSGRGPCVESLLDNELVQVNDMFEDGRWPDLAAVLTENGIRSVLGMPLHLTGAAVGSLNVYRRDPHVWDESDRRALGAFERLIERLLTEAMLGERREVLVTQLEHALAARVEIERAVGIVMATEQLDAPAAFEQVRRAARSQRKSVREIAAEVVAKRLLA